MPLSTAWKTWHSNLVLTSSEMIQIRAEIVHCICIPTILKCPCFQSYPEMSKKCAYWAEDSWTNHNLNSILICTEEDNYSFAKSILITFTSLHFTLSLVIVALAILTCSKNLEKTGTPTSRNETWAVSFFTTKENITLALYQWRRSKLI